MSKIAEAFQDGKAMIPFITAGDPSIEDTKNFIRTMADAGADLIEIGIPFSDPIAEGPVIQEADIRALASGTTPDRIFEMVKDLRRDLTIPLVFMTYLNPVFFYGYDAFFRRCSEVGIDGIIIPDLPFEEKGELEDTAASYGVDLISMVAPTSESRVRMIASEAKGFLYMVSSMGVTGMRESFSSGLEDMVSLIRSVTDIPCAIGFGIHTPEQAHRMASISDGAIVGSAVVRLVAEHGKEAAPYLADYIRSLKQAIRS